jgi:hypothetical protein
MTDHDPTIPAARLRAYWRHDPDVRADFALMPDRRILRRFTGEVWVHAGDVHAPAPADRASLEAWADAHDYEETSR